MLAIPRKSKAIGTTQIIVSTLRKKQLTFGELGVRLAQLGTPFITHSHYPFGVRSATHE